MKKTLFLILALLMVTSTVYGLELTTLQTGQLAAVGRGRSRVSDTSVLMQVWYTGSGFGAVGVSGHTSLQLYVPYTTDTILYAINTEAAGYQTVGEVVDYINDSCTDFSASIGPDGYRGLDTRYLLSRGELISRGPSNTARYDVLLDCSSAGFLTCGVPIKDFATPRIRQFISKMVTEEGSVKQEIWEDSATSSSTVWRRDITHQDNINATSDGNSSSTVVFSATGDNGIAGTKGRAFVLKSTPSSNDLDDLNTQEREAAVQISIVYDHFEGL